MQPAPKPFDPVHFTDLVDPGILRRSGSVFYSGRSAFSSPSPVYVLGLNPGGSPSGQAEETVSRDIEQWRSGPPVWSAYQDESWRGMAPGTCGLQPQVLHLFGGLGIDPRAVPASNVVFVRTHSEQALRDEKAHLLKLCWPVHRAVIDGLKASTVVCLGATAGRWVREELGAYALAGRFIERNARRWTNEAHFAPSGICVITLTHPGRANWCSPEADPTPLVRRALAGTGLAAPSSSEA